MFEIKAGFLRTLGNYAAIGGVGLLTLSGARPLLHAGTTFPAWFSHYFPWYLLWLLIVPIIFISGRQPFVRIADGRLVSRFAPARAPQSVPLSSVEPSRLISPPLSSHLVSGLKFRSPSGDVATVSVLLFSSQQLRSLADAIAKATVLPPGPVASVPPSDSGTGA